MLNAVKAARRDVEAAGAPVVPVVPVVRTILWRIHLWCALLAAPFVLVAVLTGLWYVLTPQIEAVRYAALDHVRPGAQRLPLDSLLAKASTAYAAGTHLNSVIVSADPTRSVRLVFVPHHGESSHDHTGHAAAEGSVTPSAGSRADVGAREVGSEGAKRAGAANVGLPGGAMIVYVNPYTGEVLGRLPAGERFSQWSRRLHSRLLQGEGWRWAIEFAASALMLMLMTGLVLYPSSQPGRHGVRHWHALIGVTLALLTLVMVGTGLTWSRVAGSQIRAVRDALGQAPPRPPAHLMGKMGKMGNREPGATQLDWEAVLRQARIEVPDVELALQPPAAPGAPWHVSTPDSSSPLARAELLIDGSSAQVLYRSRWAQQTAFGKATALGIPFHRGEFGLWNQCILFAFGLSMLWSLWSGLRMVWQRARRRQSVFPPLPPGSWRCVAVPLAVFATLACLLMPMLGLALPCIVVAEWWWARPA